MIYANVCIVMTLFPVAYIYILMNLFPSVSGNVIIECLIL